MIFMPSMTMAEPYLCSSISRRTSKSGVSLDDRVGLLRHRLFDGRGVGVHLVEAGDHAEVAVADDAVELAAVQNRQVTDVVLLHHLLSKRDGLLAANRVRHRTS